jgi:hypothetical protein
MAVSSSLIIKDLDPGVSMKGRELLRTVLQKLQDEYLKNTKPLLLSENMKRIWPRNDHERVSAICIDVSIREKENYHPVPKYREPHQVFRTIQIPIVLRNGDDLLVPSREIYDSLIKMCETIFIDMVVSICFVDFFIHRIKIIKDLDTRQVVLQVIYYGLRVDHVIFKPSPWGY